MEVAMHERAAVDVKPIEQLARTFKQPPPGCRPGRRLREPPWNVITNPSKRRPRGTPQAARDIDGDRRYIRAPESRKIPSGPRALEQ